MAVYRYQHGERPLEGYTIQHGLGRGGFGEVYYAISDSGREVALKAVQNYEDIELRGIKHCMNLKHPQLVSIFDIRHNTQSLPFVIMEYIDGPSLRDILDSHPEGLGAAKSAFFLKEIARGLTYLHDCGVVHRDLKPHNVFYEQGVVKIGDYSLSKAISTSHRSGHTMTVGTVHYMAPEIGVGRYDSTVDIYALGVLLYEMLTGQPPFTGDSMGEVLMKHVAGDVDVSGIDEPFARVIRKALSKDPSDRYQTAQEMVDDLMGHADLQQSVASIGPESLTIIAEKAMKQIAQKPIHLAQPLPATAPGPGPGINGRKIRQHAAAARDAIRPAVNKIANQVEHLAEKVIPTSPNDPYRYTFDVRPRGRQHRATSHKRGGLAFWIFGMIALFVALGGTAEVGHPGPLVLFIVGWVALVNYRRGHQQRAAAASMQAPGNNAHQAGVHQAGAHPDAAYPNASPPPPPNGEPQHAHKFANAARSPDAPYGYEPFTEESPYSRLVALVMSCFAIFIPIAGLQRIYVGRIKSGLLWLFTFGLLGVGQIYDIIMIALGQFRDVDGKRLLSFSKQKMRDLQEPVNRYSAVVRQQWTDSRIGFKLGNLLFNFIGGALLLIALAAGTVVAIDIPAAIASGSFGMELKHHFYDVTTMRDWNVLVSAGLGIVTLVTGTLAAICLVFARRESTWSHMLRIPAATAVFTASVLCLGSTTNFGQRWLSVADYVEGNRIGPAISMLIRHDFWPGMIFGAILFVFAIFILAWPARHRRPVDAVTPVAAEQGHSETHEKQRV